MLHLLGPVWVMNVDPGPWRRLPLTIRQLS
jgi:hypothetical protein